MSSRRHWSVARIALAMIVAATLTALGGAQSPAELPSHGARLVLDVDIEHARDGWVGTEFLRVLVESPSDWLVLGVTPELTQYCIVPDRLAGDCYTEPHTLVLAIFVGNLLEDRSVSVQLQALTPNLRAADPSSNDLPTVDGVELYSAPLRYAPSHQAVGPMVWDEVLLPPGDSQYVGLVVGFDDPGRFVGVLTFELVAVPLTDPDAGSSEPPSGDKPDGK